MRPAIALADEAAQLLDHAFRRGALADGRRTRRRGAWPCAEAKVLAHRAARRGQLAAVRTDRRAVHLARYGLDRFWRNARVHTLHDPVDYKLRALGRHALTGERARAHRLFLITACP